MAAPPLQTTVDIAAVRVARPGGEELSPRTRLLLEAAIPQTLLRLAAPNVIIIAAQAAMNVLEAVFVGWLGRDALAGVALVFPLIMLMQTMSAGGMGGGVASAVARALGAGRRRDADALVLHAVLIALVFGAAFTVGMLVGGPRLYRAMGGTEGALAAALMYSNVVFVGAIAVWLFNTLGSVLRGAGNMLLPALVVVAGGPVLVALSPALIWGWGPFPRLDIAGAGVAFVTYYTLGSIVLAVALRSRRNLVRLSLRGVRLRLALFAEILRVGLPGALNTVQTNLTVVVLTGLVGGFGTVALAGYGIGGWAPRSSPWSAPIWAPATEPAPSASPSSVARWRSPSRRRSGSSRRSGRRPGWAFSRAIPMSSPRAARTCASSGRATDSLVWGWRSISPRRAPAGCSGRWSPGSRD